MLDVERSDVVGQEHDLIAEEIFCVFLAQGTAGETLQNIDNEIAGAGAGIKDLDAGRGQRAAKLALKGLIDAGNHEVDDLLRGVNDAVGVGLSDREPLEKALVDRVEEALALGPVADAARRAASSMAR